MESSGTRPKRMNVYRIQCPGTHVHWSPSHRQWALIQVVIPAVGLRSDSASPVLEPLDVTELWLIQ